MTSDEFRKAVAGARPLKGRQRVALQGPAPEPVPHQHRRDEAAALAESMASSLSPEEALETGEELSYLRDGMARETLRKLRRGHWSVQDGIDLHGMTREQSSTVLDEFLEQCLARGLRCVRIVHGKGLGILKAKLKKWLPQREEVQAFCQAPANDGGSGALLVLLRSRR